MSWIIKQIQEAAYGCEERLPGEKTKVIVTLEHDSGERCQSLVEDDWLYENEFDEGTQFDDEECIRWFGEKQK